MSADREPDGPKREVPRASTRDGLCPTCRHLKTVVSGRGSTFYRCLRERDDPRFPKYPPQPVLACQGFEG